MTREEALAILRKENGVVYSEYEEAVDVIEKALADRPHGEWIEVPKYNGYFVCSNCLKRLDGNFERFEHWEMKKENFCPVCGSDNRGARK